MIGSIALKVVTHEGVALAEQAVSVIAPGEVGYLGMLRNHAPLVTTLQPGTLTWQRPSGERLTATLGTGLLEIAKNRCTILTTSVQDVAPTPSR